MYTYIACSSVENFLIYKKSKKKGTKENCSSEEKVLTISIYTKSKKRRQKTCSSEEKVLTTKTGPNTSSCRTGHIRSHIDGRRFFKNKLRAVTHCRQKLSRIFSLILLAVTRFCCWRLHVVDRRCAGCMLMRQCPSAFT